VTEQFYTILAKMQVFASGSLFKIWYTVSYMISITLLKIFLPAVIAFVIGMVTTPLYTKYFYQFRLWKRVSRLDNEDAMSDAFKKISLHMC
jgi:hypothetical protein